MSNLLTKEEKKLVRKEYYMRVVVVALALLFFSCILSVAELLPSFFYSSVAQALKKSELEKMIEGEATSEEVSSALKKVDAVTSFLKEEQSDSLLATDLIKEALVARPSGVVVSGITLESGTDSRVLVVSGVAATRADLIEFVSNLGKRPNFFATDVPAENLARADDISFNVRITGDF